VETVYFGVVLLAVDILFVVLLFRYQQRVLDRRNRHNPVKWQKYPLGSWLVLALICLPVFLLTLWVSFQPGQPISNVVSTTALAIAALAGLAYSAQIASYRMRVYEGILQIRSLFRNVDFTSDDIDYTLYRMFSGATTYKVRLKDGKTLNMEMSKLNFGELRRIFAAKERSKQRQRKKR